MTDRWTDDPQVQDDPALEAFLHVVSARADGSVDAAVRTATLEAMLATAVETAPTPDPGSSWVRRARRILGLTGVKLALAAGVAAATTTGGLAATGSLPAPVQEFAHDVGRRIGIGVPAAPGQLQQSDDDPDTTGRDYAPGQLKKSDGDPDTTGRDHAPGQLGDTGDVPVEPDAPTTSDEAPDGADDEVRQDGEVPRDDTGAVHRVEPDQAPPATQAPQDAGQPDDDPDRSTSSEPAEPSPSPEPEAPAGAVTQPTADPAQRPSRPDSPTADQRQDAGTHKPADNGGAADHGH